MLMQQISGSEFGVNHMNPWTKPALSTFLICDGGIMVWGRFSWHMLDPLIPINNGLNATVYLSIVADHVDPFIVPK